MSAQHLGSRSSPGLLGRSTEGSSARGSRGEQDPGCAPIRKALLVKAVDGLDSTADSAAARARARASAPPPSVRSGGVSRGSRSVPVAENGAWSAGLRCRRTSGAVLSLAAGQHAAGLAFEITSQRNVDALWRASCVAKRLAGLVGDPRPDETPALPRPHVLGRHTRHVARPPASEALGCDGPTTTTNKTQLDDIL